MAHFLNLQSKIDDVSTQYYLRTQAANDYLARETAAVISIQSFLRATQVRQMMHAVLRSARQLQRFVRGCLARGRARKLRLERSRRLNAHFFHHCATVIMKFFRGWRSRKHLHNFHGRKRYLATVENRGEHTKEWLQRFQARQAAEAKHREEQKLRDDFDSLAGELHHLVSTKAVPGVYNPPYNDSLPAAFEKPIEQHLRDSCKATVPKALRRPRHREAIAKSHGSLPGAVGGAQLGSSLREQQEAAHATACAPPQDLPSRSPHLSRTASVGRMQRIQGPFRSREQTEVASAKAVQMHRTVQAATPYSLSDEDRKMQDRISKLTRVSPIDFAAPGLPAGRPPPSSVHTGVPYKEKPVELRGDYTELPKIRDKPPFFTALQQGRHFAEYHEQPLLPSGHV
uniref:Uncharacterized protein n=1 Tax=Zooxanthella nutricula TaxID=1333877 RepID=A0A7S2ITI5_9DINO